MKTNNLILIGGLIVGAYFLLRNTPQRNDMFISTYGGSQNPLPQQSSAPIITITSESTSTIKSRQNANDTGGLITSSKNNVYDRTTGTIKVNNKGYSVSPQNAGKLIVQETIKDAQSVYSRVNINPYSRF